jgi:hypothetical protein
MDFAAVYRLCRRTQSLKRGLKAVRACLSNSSVSYIAVEEAEISIFATIKGYRFTTLEGTAFFPSDLAEVPISSGVLWLKAALVRADVVIPPYYQLGFLTKFAHRVVAAETDEESVEIGNEMLRLMYTSDGLAEIICGIWARRQTYESYTQTLHESAKAFSLGLYNVAIIGLLPCIEGIVRELGLKVGLKVESSVSIRELLKVFDRLKAKELDMMFDGYYWFPPEINSKFLGRFHERVQMYDGISDYFAKKLYQHTSEVDDLGSLNRHGIAHGLFHGYATKENFLRLFNLLSALSMVAAIVERRGSLMHQGSNEDSIQLTKRLEICRLMAAWIR